MKHMVKGLALSATAIVGFAFAAHGATTIYVGGDQEGAVKTLEEANAALAELTAPEDYPVEIVIAKGTYPSAAFTLDATLPGAVVVRGATGNPKDVVITHTAGTSPFTVSQADARIESLTVSGAGFRHVFMSAGVMTNCVITGGTATGTSAEGGNVYLSGSALLVDSEISNGSVPKYYGKGGNVRMAGGRLVRCKITGGNAAGSSGIGGWSYGSAVFASAGTVESCLICQNACGDAGRGAVYLDGAATVANCTIVDNTSTTAQIDNGFGAGVAINNASATVVNTVIYGNGDRLNPLSLKQEVGNKSLNRFFCCASSATNTSCATWKVIDESAFGGYAARNYAPADDSPLVDAGTTDDSKVPQAVLEEEALDFAGTARLAGDSLDIGAFELDPTLTIRHFGAFALQGKDTFFKATAAHADGVTPKFKWDFGDGSSVEPTTEETVGHIYDMSGLFDVSVSVSLDDGANWSAAKHLSNQVLIVPEHVYVDPNGTDPVWPYGDRIHAAKSLAMAFTALTNTWSENLPCVGTVVIVEGAKLEGADNTGFTLKYPVTVKGETGDPADAEIVDATSGKRAFTLRHADARIESLTISGKGYQNNAYGCHLDMTDGVVTNCVIKGGTSSSSESHGGNILMSGGLVVDSDITGGSVCVNYYNQGGNVWMSGGRISRCNILAGKCSDSVGHCKGGGVFATGGTIESCLVMGNTSSGKSFGGGLYLDGAVKIVNCTVVDNTAAAGTVAGIYVNNTGARIVNTVIYGNQGGTEVTATSEFGTSGLGCYSYCASSATNTSCATWTVITDSAFDGYTAQNYALSGSSPLKDAGTVDPAVVPAASTVLDPGALDFAGNARKSGPSLDIGAYELDQSLTLSLVGDCGVQGDKTWFEATAEHEDGVTPVFKWNFGDGTGDHETTESPYGYVFAAGGLYSVSVSVSLDDGATWSAAKSLSNRVLVIPEYVYVDPNGTDPVWPYGEKLHAATNLAMAFTALTNTWSANEPCVGTVVIVAGAKLEGEDNTGFTLKYPVTVKGETGNPADAEIVDATSGKRAFTLKHDGARLESLTISGAGYQGILSGGHVQMSNGIVSNCVITGGTATSPSGIGGNVYMSGGLVVDSEITKGSVSKDWYGRGGNVRMYGGRLLRCRITGGDASAPGGAGDSTGGGIQATGGTIENCLIAQNKAGARSTGGGIYLDGAVSVVNCTVVDNTAPAGNVAGIEIAIGTAPTIVNTVIYGNKGGTEVAATSEFGTVGCNRFSYCASSATNTSCATWTVITDSAFDGYTAQNYALSGSSPLKDAGTVDPTVVPATSTVLDQGALDLAGEPRNSGRSLDIGAYELDQSLTITLVGDHGVQNGTTWFEATAEHEDGVTPVFKWNFGDSTGDHKTTESPYGHVFAAGGFFDVSVAVSLDGGATWSAAKHLSSQLLVVPEHVYVDPNGTDPVWPYGEKLHAATNLAMAFTALTNTWSANLPCAGTVVIVEGAKLEGEDNTGFTLKYPVTVKGETGNPADAEIVDSTSGKRAFTLKHDGARVESLTVSGTGWQGAPSGGHINLSGGMVSNCVVKGGGSSGSNGHGGNVWMTAGLVVDSEISGGTMKTLYNHQGGNVWMNGGRLLRCKVHSGSISDGNGNCKGSGIFATGGAIESCLVRDNAAAGISFGSGIYLDGAASVVNCTVVDNTSPAGRVAGIYVNNTGARIVNTVIYGNKGGTEVSATSEFGTAGLGCYSYCASSATNGLDETTCKLIDADAFKSYAKWQATGELRHLVPAAGKPLKNGGTPAKGYPETGAVSEKDLLGQHRIIGKFVDIGALEAPNACSYILIR